MDDGKPSLETAQKALKKKLENLAGKQGSEEMSNDHFPKPSRINPSHKVQGHSMAPGKDAHREVSPEKLQSSTQPNLEGQGKPKVPDFDGLEAEVQNSKVGEENSDSHLSGRERRRYPRVQVHPISQLFTVEIVGFGPTDVFDISLNGVALAQPLEKQIVTNKEVVTVRFTSNGTGLAVEILSHVIRLDSKVIALEFVDIPTEGRKLLEQVVSDRVIGLNMSLVDPRYYHSSSSFSYWFHGPMETNLYLWEDTEKGLSRAQFDINDSVLFFENGSFSYETRDGNESSKSRLRPRMVLMKAHKILSQLQTNLFSLESLQALVEKQIG